MTKSKFDSLRADLSTLSPEEKLKACNEMGVTPLVIVTRDKSPVFPTVPGPFRILTKQLAMTCDLIEDTHRGFLDTRFKLTDPTLSALVATETMTEEGGIVNDLASVLRTFRNDVLTARKNAMTTFAQNRFKSRSKGKPEVKEKVREKAKSGKKQPEAKKPAVPAPAPEKAQPKVAQPEAKESAPAPSPAQNDDQKSLLITKILEMSKDEDRAKLEGMEVASLKGKYTKLARAKEAEAA